MNTIPFTPGWPFLAAFKTAQRVQHPLVRCRVKLDNGVEVEAEYVRAIADRHVIRTGAGDQVVRTDQLDAGFAEWLACNPFPNGRYQD